MPFAGTLQQPMRPGHCPICFSACGSHCRVRVREARVSAQVYLWQVASGTPIGGSECHQVFQIHCRDGYNKVNDMMKKFTESAQGFIRQDGFFPLVLLLVIAAAYGAGMSGLNFQGDDWHQLWLQYRIGDLSPFFNLTRFSTLWFFQAAMPLLKPVAWQWLLVTLALRWLGGMSLYLLLKQVLTEAEESAAVFCLLFCLYPGFLMGFLPVTFLAQFLQPACLFGSFFFMAAAIKANKQRKRWCVLGALILSAANLLLSEYFFLLELLRPVVIWMAYLKKERKPPALRQIMQSWMPYLAAFTAILLVRIWTQVYSGGRAVLTLQKYSLQPAAFLLQFSRQALADVHAILIQPILAAFSPQMHLLDNHDWLVLFSALSCSLLVFFYLRKQPINNQNHPARFLSLTILSLAAFLLAALPFWLAGLRAYFGFELLNRMALPQGLSFTLLLWAWLHLLPVRWRWLRDSLLAFLAGSFALLQLQSAALFRAEWERRREIMQQLAWRAPALTPGTVIIMNDPGFLLSGENSLSAELNWNYVHNPRPRQADYFIYFNEHRFLSDFGDIHADRMDERMHMIGPTALNPSHLLILQLNPAGCLRVLDPQLDMLDKGITSFTRTYLPYAKPSVIVADRTNDSLTLDPAIYVQEAEHGWCYYFQKTDLARQQGDWPAAGEYADRGLELKPEAVDPAELCPFIQALAHNDKWDAARRMTEEILNQSASQNRRLCALWQHMAAGTNPSPARGEALAWMTARTGCNF